MVLRPSLHMAPQDGVGGETPIPMKERNASVKIAVGTAKVMLTMIKPRVFGIICLDIRYILFAPRSLEAFT